jgi:hypothetical protein
MAARLAIACVVIGCLLFLVSWIWPHFVGGRGVWSEHDAVELANAQTEVHALREQAGMAFEKQQRGDTSSNSQQIATKLEAAEARYRHLNANLQEARDKGNSVAQILRWIGIGTAAAGAAGFVVTRAGVSRSR